MKECVMRQVAGQARPLAHTKVNAAGLGKNCLDSS